MRDYLQVAQQYEADVLGGVEPACLWVRLACTRNARDRARSGTPAFPYAIDPEKAAKICRMAERLPHIKGPKAVVLGFDSEHRKIWATLTLEPWQCWLFTTVFGWVHRETRLRRFRIALTLVPRKNGKSMLGAVVALFMLTAAGEGGPECYSAATTRDQAKAVAEICWEMASRSPQFCAFYGVRVGSKTTCSLTVPAMAGKFLPLSADANTLDGLNVSLAVIDELHKHKTRAVWDVLDTATGARLQPLLFAITTAGVDIAGICYEKLAYLQKVLEGTLEDETFFGINYTIDEADDYRLEANQRKANPNYGVSVQADDLARKTLACSQSSAAVNNFLTKHCNVWVRAESTWMPMPDWIAQGDRALRLEDFLEVPCWIGVDLAEVRDIAAVVVVFRPDRERYVLFGTYYLPEATIAKSPTAQMSGWVRDGCITETEGNQADYQRIEDDILGLYEQLNVQEIDFDRALAAQMGQNLKRRLLAHMGKDAAESFVVTVPQNVETMNPAMQAILGLVLAGKFQHDGNPAGNWMWSNVVVEANYKGEIYPRKAGGKDSANKIDSATATFSAFSRASQAVIGPPRRRRVPKRYTPDGFVPAVPPETGAADARV